MFAQMRGFVPVLFVSSVLLLLASCASAITYDDVRGTPYTVTYDHRAMRINGQRLLMQSGSVHYPRYTYSGELRLAFAYVGSRGALFFLLRFIMCVHAQLDS